MHHINTNLLERAADLIDELASHPSGADATLIAAIDSNDLEEVRYQVMKIEGELANEHFRNYDLAVFL
jgi:hypothetical protein